MRLYKIHGTEKIDKKYEKELNLERILKYKPGLMVKKFYEYALRQSFRVKNSHQEEEYFKNLSAILFRLSENEEFINHFNSIREEIGTNIQRGIEYPSSFITLMRPR